MRILAPLLLALAAGACGSVEYRDTNAAVDADPLCASRPDRPNEPVSERCRRQTGASYILGKPKAEPLDLGGASRREEDPR